MLTRNQIHDRLTSITGEIKAQRSILGESHKAAQEQANLADIAAQAVTKNEQRLEALLQEARALAKQYAEAVDEIVIGVTQADQFVQGSGPLTLQEQAEAVFNEGNPVTPYPNGESRLNAIFDEATNP